MKKLFLTMMCIAALTACNNDDNALDDIQQHATTGARTYTMRIAATLDDAEAQGETRAITFGGTDAAPTATGKFLEGECVLVYNVTKEAFLHGYLTPTDISSDGKSCTLDGEFIGAVDNGDELTLIYYGDDDHYSYMTTDVYDGMYSGLSFWSGG